MSQNTLQTYRGRITNLSPLTQARYLQQVQDFQRAVGVKDSYTTGDVEQYLQILQGEGKSSNYRRWVFAVLRSFYDIMDWPWFTRKQEKRLRPKQEDEKRPYLRETQMGRLLEAIASKPEMIQAMIRIAVLRPTRRIELKQLNREDYLRPFLRIKTRKEGEPTTLSLDDQTCQLLDAYLLTRTDEEPALFISSLGRRVSLPYLTQVFRQLLEELGLYKTGLGWHGVRRGVATMLSKAGAQEGEIQVYGGWRSRQTVHRYIQLEGPEVEEKVKKIHPLIKR